MEPVTRKYGRFLPGKVLKVATKIHYTEDTLVQQTTAEYLERELGWESVYAYNNEDFGPDSLLGRASDREVVLTRFLRAKLEELNPGLPDAAYDDAVRQIVTASASQTMAAVNREKYDLIRDGVQVVFRNSKGERVRQRLRVFDFDNPENNHFLCVRELWVRGDLYRRGGHSRLCQRLPLLFMDENVSKDIRAAYERNFLDYKDTVPHLFHHNAVVVLANGVEAKLGSLTSRFEHFHEWKRLAENQPGVVTMETLLKGVCAKANFLDLVENFIVFTTRPGNRGRFWPVTTSSWVSTGPSRRFVTGKAGPASWECSGTPRARERAIPWCSSPARFIASWAATSPC